VRSVAEAESAAKAEDPITLPPDEQQKLAEAQEKAARELAEQARQELLPAVPGEESTRPEQLLSADEERRLRDGTARGERELDEAIQEAVADGRGIRQQVREQMLRTEREWVVNVPEKTLSWKKRSVGTDSGRICVCLPEYSLWPFCSPDLWYCSGRPVQPGIRFCRCCVKKGFGRAELNCCCAADRRSSVPVS
jgi:hypothetical protein